MHEPKPKRKLGFMIVKDSMPVFDEALDQELDREVLKLFYPNQCTKDTIERSEAGTDVFRATNAKDLFKKLNLEGEG